MTWKEDQEFEREWHSTCQNTYGEEEKQLTYAKYMGLKFFYNGKSPYNIDMQGKSVCDIGAGPCSLLLKCVNVKGLVIDPCEYPDWVYKRYEAAGISVGKNSGENFDTKNYHCDEVWCYNCLQHVESVEKVISNAKACSKLIRIFEWLDNGVSKGHPNNLTELELNRLLGGEGKVQVLNNPTLKGKCFSGIFKGDLF